MIVMVFLMLCFILAQTFSDVDSTGLLQQPDPQYVLIESNAIFSCEVCDSYVIWEVMFSDGTMGSFSLMQMQRPDVDVYYLPPEASERTSILTINTSDASTWNNTMVQCVVHYGEVDIWSNNVPLVIYTSLKPPPPSNVWINAINTTTLSLNWIPAFLWPGYKIHNFSMNITNINTSERVLETSVDMEETMESIQHFTFSNINVSYYACTEFLFSISSVSALYGESDPIVTTGGFHEVPSEAIFINKAVYFRANGTPLVELEVELPRTVCSYQDINYTILIKEQPPSGLNQGFIIGPFSHRGSGRVKQRILFGLVTRKSYSLSVIVNTAVGNSKTRTYFDTEIWFEVSEGNNITNSQPDHSTAVVHQNNMPHYIITLGALLAVAMMIIIGFIVSYVSCFVKKKKKHGSQSISRKIMVNNPIYDHRGPVYDTIPTIPSETLADSEVSEIPTVSGFQNLSSTSTNAYVDEPHSSSLQRNPLGNVHTPSVCLNLKDDINAANGCTTAPSLEEGCGGQVVTEPEKGEETYTLMIPAACGTVTNKKS